jgi:2-polyprenyl-3-methyl-5-hydroxy-6-metoxy-1,4-benzoquinol methylase
MQTKTIQRKEPCRICGSTEAFLLANIDYWDLQSTDLVQCKKCRFSQLDPMLTPKNQDVGCEAYHIKERFEINEKEQKRNLIRNFRRGVAFGHSLKLKGINPQNVLEFGPGSGYFLEGIKFVFPTVKVTVVDIVQAVLDFNKKEHGYETIKSLADNLNQEHKDRYDLIIARDIIEHVGNIDQMIKNIGDLLCAGGVFHFITPNGHEDYWGHKMCHDILNESSELLINHVNYFDGESLKQLLLQNNFSPVQYYTYQFKNFIKGKGWKKSLDWTTKSSKKTASTMNQLEAPEKPLPTKEELFKEEWYISKKYPLLTIMYCHLKHAFLIRRDPQTKYGHEIFGLFKKKRD